MNLLRALQLRLQKRSSPLESGNDKMTEDFSKFRKGGDTLMFAMIGLEPRLINGLWYVVDMQNIDDNPNPVIISNKGYNTEVEA